MTKRCDKPPAVCEPFVGTGPCDLCATPEGCCTTCRGTGLVGSIEEVRGSVAFVDRKCAACNGSGESGARSAQEGTQT